jgi:hypothetical protein
MPFETSDHGQYFYSRLFGVLTPDDLVTLAAEIERLEDAAACCKDRIADCTALDEVEISFPDVLLLANRRLARTFTRRVKSAVIARKPVHIGFARMFQTLNEHPQIDIRIVASMDEALKWIVES